MKTYRYRIVRVVNGNNRTFYWVSSQEKALGFIKYWSRLTFDWRSDYAVREFDSAVREFDSVEDAERAVLNDANKRREAIANYARFKKGKQIVSVKIIREVEL